MKISQEEIERHRAAERLKGERDAADLLATAKLLSREEGLEKGTRIGRIQLFQQLQEQPVTSKIDLDRLSVSDLVRLEESLTEQLSRKKQVNGTPPPGPT